MAMVFYMHFPPGFFTPIFLGTSLPLGAGRFDGLFWGGFLVAELSFIGFGIFFLATDLS